MKTKDIAFFTTIIPLVFGLLIVAFNNFVGALIYLGYAWASYFRYRGSETAKRVCFTISVIVMILYLLTYNPERMFDIVFWATLIAIDGYLLNKKIEE